MAAASLLESERGLTSTSSAVDPTGTIGTDTAARTLKPSTRSYSANGSFAHQLSNAVSASLNAQASYATSDALQGLADATLAVPASSPDAAGPDAPTLDRFLAPVALGQRTSTASAHGGLTVNADLSTRWKLSLIAAYDHSDSRTGTDRGYDTTTLQAALTAGAAGVDPYGVLSPTVLGPIQRDHATALADSGSASILAMGKLLKLPAGDMHTSVRVGGDVSALTATSVGSGVSGATITRRSDSNGQVSLDLPLTSRRSGFLAGVGTLTANINAGVTQVSGYGALGTLGYGANWTPRTGLTVIVSINEDRVAPTLQQLDAPTIATANLRLYDYLRGETAMVTQITGGNPGLKADDRHVFKLGLTLNPLRHASFSVTANYINSRTRNAIGTLLGATAATQAVFADRFIRDASGTLAAVDSRLVNFASEDRQELRWGFTLSQVLRAPQRPPPPGWHPPAHVGAAPGRQGAADAPGQVGSRADGTPPDGANYHPQGDDEDVVVEGRRERGGDDGGPPSPPPGGFDDGMGPPPGPPPNGFGPPPGGPGGPPGGGPGGGPGGRPGGGPGGFSGSDNGVRLQVSAYHSWNFSNRVLLREGGPVIDLLDGGTIGSGGQPRHSVQFNTGLVDNGLGLRLSGSWQSATRVDGGTTGATDTLRFSSIVTFDLRLFANLANRFRGKAWARGTRVTLAVGNLFDTRQRVADASGTTPLIYQGAFLDPYGRTLSFSVRRLF